MSKSSREKSKHCAEDCEKKILIVDDDPINLNVLKELLEFLNFKPFAFDNGAEALSCFQAQLKKTCCVNKIHVVFTDIQMPQMDGYMLSQAIRASELAWAESIAAKSKIGLIKA